MKTQNQDAKPIAKITRHEMELLNKMNNEAFFEVNMSLLEKSSKNASESILKFSNLFKSLNKKSYFEQFYDYVGNFINGGKSIAPDELKTFA